MLSRRFARLLPPCIFAVLGAGACEISERSVVELDAAAAGARSGAGRSGSGNGGGDSALGAGGSVGSGGARVANCDLTKPFGAPAPLTSLNTAASESSLSLFHGGFGAVFVSDRPSPQVPEASPRTHIWTAERPRLNDSFGPAHLVDGLSQVGGVDSASISEDGLTVYVSAHDDSGQMMLFSAARPDVLEESFAPLQLVRPGGGPNSAGVGVRVRADGQRVYFVDAFPPQIAGDLYSIDHLLNGYSAPSLVSAIANAPRMQGASAVTPDDLTLYLTSTRPGGFGGKDIWVSRRPRVDLSFGEPNLVAELNTGLDEQVDFISGDGCTLYFELSRGQYDDIDVFSASKPPASTPVTSPPDPVDQRCATDCVKAAFNGSSPSSCGICHSGPAPLGGLDLTVANVTQRLKDVPSLHVDTQPDACPFRDLLIDTRAWENSWLLKKVKGEQGNCGSHMPPTPFPPADVICIETYVRCVAGK